MDLDGDFFWAGSLLAQLYLGVSTLNMQYDVPRLRAAADGGAYSSVGRATDF